jgi:hypothetical protein
VSLLIVKTLVPERPRARLSQVESALEYLRGHIHLALEDATLGGVYAPDLVGGHLWLGPGARPKAIEQDADIAHSLKSLFPHETFLPIDPWGNAYAMRVIPHQGRDILTIATGGSDGILPTHFSLEANDILQVLWPRP